MEPVLSLAHHDTTILPSEYIQEIVQVNVQAGLFELYQKLEYLWQMKIVRQRVQHLLRHASIMLNVLTKAVTVVMYAIRTVLVT